MNDLGLRRDRFHFSSCLRMISVYINVGIKFFKVDGCSLRYDIRSLGLAQHIHLVGKVGTRVFFSLLSYLLAWLLSLKNRSKINIA